MIEPSAASMRATIALAMIAGAIAAQRTRPQPFFAWSRLDFAAEEYAARRQALTEALADTGGGIFLALSAEGSSTGGTFRQLDDFFYFTGLELPRSILAIDCDAQQVTLFVPGTDRRFEDPARRNDFPGRRLARDPELAKRSGIHKIQVLSQFADSVAQWAAAGRVIRLNGHGARTTTGDLFSPGRPVQRLRQTLQATSPATEVRDAHAAITRLRMVKSPAEIARLRRAAQITADGIREAAAAVRPGVFERALEGELERSFKRQGAQRLAFASIIKSGPNSLWPWRILAAHYDRRNRQMAAGELVIFDVGCELDHYASDVGRTFPVSGTFTSRQRELLEMVTGVADTVIAKTAPGATLARLRRVADSAIPPEARPYMQTGSFFGHHIGLEVGDPAIFDAALAPGMVFTVEPWYYNHDDGVAVFVEDIVLVTEDGAENLTGALPRAPAELQQMVAASEAHLTVLSFNIRHGVGLDDRLDLERAASLIERLAPDIAVIQEVDLGTRRTGGADQARTLGARCGMESWFGPFMPYQGGHYGMALLSRRPVEAHFNLQLPDGSEPRTTLAAQVQLSGGGPQLWVAGVHLYETEEQRLAQAEALIEYFARQPLPVVLAGDFNSRPDSPVMAALAPYWRPAGGPDGADTFPADAPDHRIDYVLLPTTAAVRVVEQRVITDPLTSDHRAVWVELALPRD